MKITANKARMEIIFPVVLFLIFTLSALFIILYAARTYQHIVEDSNIEYDKSTSLTYIVRKIQAGDSGGNVSVSSILGIDAVSIYQSIDDVDYVTYIFVHDNKLKELFTTRDNKNINPNAGTVLFDMDEFVPVMTSEKLLSLKIKYDGKEYTKYVSLLTSPTTEGVNTQ